MSLGGDLLFIVFFNFSTIQVHNGIKNLNVTNSYFSGNYISLAGFGQVAKVAFEKHLQVVIFPQALSSFLNYRILLKLMCYTSENEASDVWAWE